MSQETKRNLEVIGLIFSVIGGAFGAAGMVGAFYVLPYRMNAAEVEIRRISETHEKDHELLLRIEERLINIQKTVARPN